MGRKEQRLRQSNTFWAQRQAGLRPKGDKVWTGARKRVRGAACLLKPKETSESGTFVRKNNLTPIFPLREVRSPIFRRAVGGGGRGIYSSEAVRPNSRVLFAGLLAFPLAGDTFLGEARDFARRSSVGRMDLLPWAILGALRQSYVRVWTGARCDPRLVVLGRRERWAARFFAGRPLVAGARWLGRFTLRGDRC